MIDKQMDEILSHASAKAFYPVDAALLERISKSIGPGLKPVRPLAPVWLLTGALIVISIAIACIGAAGLGFSGVLGLSGLERAMIFPLLAVLILLGAVLSVGEIIPGSRPLASPAWLGVGVLALVAVFAFLFHDYRTDDFAHRGIVCLIAGIIFAAPAALGIWLVLRRGFPLNPVVAGLIGGTLAGLAGITMLELHCPNFELFHILLWHTSVVIISAALGACAGALTRR